MRSPRGAYADSTMSLGASGRQLMREGMHAGEGERGEGGEGKNGEALQCSQEPGGEGGQGGKGGKTTVLRSTDPDGSDTLRNVVTDALEAARVEASRGEQMRERAQRYSSLGQQKRHRREARDVLRPLVRRTGDDRRRSFGKTSGSTGSSRSTRTQLSQRALAMAKQRSQRSVRERLESQIAKSGLGLRRVSRAKPGSDRWKAAADIQEDIDDLRAFNRNEREPTRAHK